MGEIVPQIWIPSLSSLSYFLTYFGSSTLRNCRFKSPPPSPTRTFPPSPPSPGYKFPWWGCETFRVESDRYDNFFFSAMQCSSTHRGCTALWSSPTRTHTRAATPAPPLTPWTQATTWSSWPSPEPATSPAAPPGTATREWSSRSPLPPTGHPPLQHPPHLLPPPLHPLPPKPLALIMALAQAVTLANPSPLALRLLGSYWLRVLLLPSCSASRACADYYPSWTRALYVFHGLNRRGGYCYGGVIIT